MAKMAKNVQKIVIIFFGPPTHPLFCIKDKKKPIYTKCKPYMGLHSCQLPGLLKKWLKNAKKYFFQTPFWGHFQKSETGSESMSRSVMASSFQKWS